jgi:hypothetical protein
VLSGDVTDSNFIVFDTIGDRTHDLPHSNKLTIIPPMRLFGIQIDLALRIRSNQILTYEDNCLSFKEIYKFIRRSK